MKISGLRASQFGVFVLAVATLEVGLDVATGGVPPVMAKKADDAQFSAPLLIPDEAEKSHSRAALVHLDTAIQALQSDDFDTALAAYNQILAHQDKFNAFDIAIAYKMRGMANVASGQYEAALADLKLAIAHPYLTTPDVSELQLVVARVTFLQGHIDEAVGLLSAWLDRAVSPSAEALFFAAQVYLEAGLSPDAERFVEQGLRQMDSEVAEESFYAIAVAVFIQQKKFDEALPLLRTMESLWPQG